MSYTAAHLTHLHAWARLLHIQKLVSATQRDIGGFLWCRGRSYLHKIDQHLRQALGPLVADSFIAFLTLRSILALGCGSSYKD